MFLEKYQKVLPDLIEIQNAPNYTKDPTYEFGWLLYLDGKYNLINQQDNFLKNLLYIFLSCLALLFFISPRKRIHVLQGTCIFFFTILMNLTKIILQKYRNFS